MRIPLVSRFAMDLKNILAYNQRKDGHRWHTVAVLPVCSACLLVQIGAERRRERQAEVRSAFPLPHVAPRLVPYGTVMASAQARPVLACFFLDVMLGICFFGTNYGVKNYSTC